MTWVGIIGAKRVGWQKPLRACPDETVGAAVAALQHVARHAPIQCVTRMAADVLRGRLHPDNSSYPRTQSVLDGAFMPK